MKSSRFHREAAAGYAAGYDKGYDSGYERGLADGYEWGRTERMEATSILFQGTSIIIPTYNQRGLLQQCIDSIRTYTEQPYELIIIDNASTDGTAEYLQSIETLARFRVNSKNLGFAGAINQGLAMARGSTLLLLNNDTVVTVHWLRNLLRCLESDPQIGIVGPITNYISGPQFIEVSYANMEEMHRFARSNNRSDPTRWIETDRLTGFCMLMRRDVFEAVGYFDEGFEVGNCEDDDYGHRIRLLGWKLVIAHDSFIHHHGSASIRTVERLEEIYAKNIQYFNDKWKDCDWSMSQRPGQLKRMIDYYPSEVAVQDNDDQVYWISEGRRFHIAEPDGLDAVRLTQTDLSHYPIAGSMTGEEAKERIRWLNKLQPDGTVRSGAIVRMPKGDLYQFDRGRLRKVMNEWAYQAWALDARVVVPYLESPRDRWKFGEQIIAPCCIKAENL